MIISHELIFVIVFIFAPTHPIGCIATHHLYVHIILSDRLGQSVLNLLVNLELR